jgi:hypothetical protein
MGTRPNVLNRFHYIILLVCGVFVIYNSLISIAAVNKDMNETGKTGRSKLADPAFSISIDEVVDSKEAEETQSSIPVVHEPMQSEILVPANATAQNKSQPSPNLKEETIASPETKNNINTEIEPEWKVTTTIPDPNKQWQVLKTIQVPMEYEHLYRKQAEQSYHCGCKTCSEAEFSSEHNENQYSCNQRVAFLINKRHMEETEACRSAYSFGAYCPERCSLDTCQNMVDTNVTEGNVSLKYIMDTYGDGMHENHEKFLRYNKVAIVSKVHWPKDLLLLKRMFCILKAAYNRYVNYDIVLFSTIPWDDEQVLELGKVVSPAKLTVAVDGPSLEEHLATMTDDEMVFLKKRCMKDELIDTQNLTWMHHCTEPGSTHTVNLAYSWQAEFRSYHIWKHAALEPYKWMMWMDSDSVMTQTWKTDPMKIMIENNLTVLFDNFPQGVGKHPKMGQKMMEVYNDTIKNIFLSENGQFNVKNKLASRFGDKVNIPQIHGFHHITNLDVYRSDLHYKFLKNFVGEYKFSRMFDDQLAVTIVGAMEANGTRAWDMYLNGHKPMIRHNAHMDGKTKYQIFNMVNWWKKEGRHTWEEGKLLCDTCFLKS